MHDVKRIVRQLERDGWDVRYTKGGHIRLASPDGETLLFASSTPSDWRAVAKLKSQIRKAKGPSSRSNDATQQRP